MAMRRNEQAFRVPAPAGGEPLLAFAGDTHGRILEMYDLLRARPDGSRAAVLFQVGDLGVWLDDGASAGVPVRHRKVSEFRRIQDEKIRVPVPTFFIKGNHEDQEILARAAPQAAKAAFADVAPGLHYIPNARSVRIAVGEAAPIVVAALGGNLSTNWFERKKADVPGLRRRHYLKEEIEALRKGPPPDVLLLHEGPVFEEQPEGKEVLRDLVEALAPAVVFFGHHHKASRGTIGKTRVIGLAGIWNEGFLEVLAPGELARRG